MSKNHNDSVISMVKKNKFTQFNHFKNTLGEVDISLLKSIFR